MQELHKGIYGASLFRLVHSTAERKQHRLHAWSQEHIYEKLSLDCKLRSLGTEDWLPEMTRHTARAQANDGKPMLRPARQTGVKVLTKVDASNKVWCEHRELPFQKLLHEIETNEIQFVPEDDVNRQLVQAVTMVFVSAILNRRFQEDISEAANDLRMSGRLVKTKIKLLHRILTKAYAKYNGDVTCVLDPVRCSIVFRDPDMWVQF